MSNYLDQMAIRAFLGEPEIPVRMSDMDNVEKLAEDLGLRPDQLTKQIRATIGAMERLRQDLIQEVRNVLDQPDEPSVGRIVKYTRRDGHPRTFVAYHSPRGWHVTAWFAQTVSRSIVSWADVLIHAGDNEILVDHAWHVLRKNTDGDVE
jgi:hypothetical protein